jgi:3-methyladenine DNA glycosylase AlkD
MAKDAEVGELPRAATDTAGTKLPSKRGAAFVIRSIAAKPRPRRAGREAMPQARLGAKQFVDALRKLADPSEKPRVARFFHPDPDAESTGNRVLGVSIGRIFPVAKQFEAMSLADIERLLDSPYYEVRMGAVSIMDFQARDKRISAEARKALFDLYTRRHDRINNWDLVDRAAPHVVGGYLADKSRQTLYDLARSTNPWKRRTAIVSTWYFIRAGDVDDTFRIAELLVDDEHALVQKAVGSWLREAGKRDQPRLVRFLDAHAGAMPRAVLRCAMERLPGKTRAKYLLRG